MTVRIPRELLREDPLDAESFKANRYMLSIRPVEGVVARAYAIADRDKDGPFVRFELEEDLGDLYNPDTDQNFSNRDEDELVIRSLEAMLGDEEHPNGTLDREVAAEIGTWKTLGGLRTTLISGGEIYNPGATNGSVIRVWPPNITIMPIETKVGSETIPQLDVTIFHRRPEITSDDI